MIAAERETVITSTDEDPLVHIWSAQKRHINAMRKNPEYREVRSGRIETSEWAEFTIPADRWKPNFGAKSARVVTPEQRAAAAQRLADYHAAQKEGAE
jgi:hypothetical protein